MFAGLMERMRRLREKEKKVKETFSFLYI